MRTNYIPVFHHSCMSCLCYVITLIKNFKNFNINSYIFFLFKLLDTDEQSFTILYPNLTKDPFHHLSILTHSSLAGVSPCQRMELFRGEQDSLLPAEFAAKQSAKCGAEQIIRRLGSPVEDILCESCATRTQTYAFYV
jgi:hypothetical protein